MNLPELHITSIKRPLSGWPWTEETDADIYAIYNSWPKISIITPSYNQGNYLEQTIRSVLCQNYPNLEYILIDGKSSDQSVDIIRRYSQCLHFWVSEPDAGQSDALNKGFARATGEILAWINSDDYYEKDAFFKVAFQYKKTGFTFLCGRCQMIDQEGQLIQELHTKKISYNTLIRYWKPHFCPPQPSVFFKRTSLEELGNFNPDLKYAMDYDIWLRASKKYSFRTINENISYYRVHLNSKTGSVGGLAKFIPEWKMLINKSLNHESVYTKWKYRLHENWFRIINRVSSLFQKHELKKIARQWFIRNQM